MNAIKLPVGTKEDESVLAEASVFGYRQVWYNFDVHHIVRHRLRGPAIIRNDGKEEWYRYGKLYTPTAHEKMMWELRKKNECS